MNDLKPRKSKKKIWISALIILVLVAVAGVILFKRQDRLEITYREVKVGRGRIEVTILGTGTVQPENRVEIKPPVAGRIEQVLVKEGQLVRKGQILAWMSSTERAALLDAARSQGEEEVKRWEENYRPTPVIAPINGTIILRNVESGQTFTNADPVFVMSDRLMIKAQVDETDIAQIKLKQEAKIVLDAYPGQPISARVGQIAFEAKTVSNVTTYEVGIIPSKTPEFMRSGMTVNVTFLVEAKDDVISIPNEALRVEEDRYSVLVPDPQDPKRREKPIQRPIQVGITDGKLTEVVSGLVEGETVLVAEIKPSTGGKPSGGNPLNPFGGNRRGGRR